MNDNRHSVSVAGPAYLEAATSERGDLEDGADEQGGDTDVDDSSTVLGDPCSPSSVSLVDDGEASTVAETGSVGTNDERWCALIRDLESEDQPTADMENLRSEAEEKEAAARDREYRHAVAGEEDMSVKDTKAGRARQISGSVSTVLPVQRVEAVNPQGGKLAKLDERRPPVSNESPKIVLVHQSGNHNLSQDLVDHFRGVWQSYKPGPPTGPINPGPGRHGIVGWIGARSVVGGASGQAAAQLVDNPGQTKVNDGVGSDNRVSESDRILQAFDPREDVIGILRPKAKGEKNTLNDIAVDSKQPKKPKAPKSEIVNVEPVRPVGKVENQFKLLKEERLRRQIAGEGMQTPAGQQTEPIVSEAQILAKEEKASGEEKLLAQPLIPLTNEAPPQLGLAENPNWPVRTSRKPQFTPFSVKTGDLLNDPDLIVQEPTISKDIAESAAVFENEVQLRKSLRFQGVSLPYKTVAVQNIRPSSAPMVKGPPASQPLVSILKNNVASTVFNNDSKTKAYNHEYVREVVIRNLPSDITYSGLLDQVSGGLLEKVMIDWSVLEARIVFAEPEAAQRFYSKVEQNGLWVHTELPHIRLVGKEGLIQCTLGAFLWTQHSSPMSPTMIEGIWKRRASRCLLINDFPKAIMTEKLVKDMLTLFAGSPVQGRDIIETVGIKRNLQVSSTGFLACVRFTAIMFAVKVGKELRKISPAYADVNAIYDADPCGGLGGVDPPSVWGLGKGAEHVKPEPKLPVPQVTQPQTSTTIRRPVTQRLTGAYRGQSSTIKAGRAFGRPPVSQPQRQTRPSIASVTGQAPGITPPGRTFAEAAGAAQRATTRPIREQLPPAPLSARQRFPPVPPNAQQDLTQRPGFRYNYNNWDAEPEAEIPTPEGAHWNHREQNLVHEYQQALVKKRRRGSDTDKTPTLDKKSEKLKPETSYYDRLVYLTNLPRDVNVTRLLRFIRGGAVEHLILQPPSSQYDTCKAIIIFIHRSSAREYKSYLQSPGLVIARGHRVACMEDVNDRRFDGIRLVPSMTIRSDNLTRCLRADKLPRGTTLAEVLGAIEEGMNHSTLEFENAIIDVSPEDRDMVVVILRLVSIGRAVWAAGMLRKRYDGMVLSYDRDPCQGPLTELEEVNIKEDID